MFSTPKAGKMPRILLAGVFGPYGVDDAFGRKDNIMELFHNQVTKAQGIASLRFLHRSFGLYFLAANVAADVTVLDFPSRERFIREVRKGYDMVGISFITPNFAKAREMARLTRQYAPNSQILIGGHGAAIEGIEQLIECDHVVRGEGIRWLRRHLGQAPDEPIIHPAMFANDYHRVFGVPIPGITAGLLVPGVGCANGCRFCSTTHFFGGYTPFIASGREMYDVACRISDRLGCDTFFVQDENFLKEHDRAAEFLAAMRERKRWFGLHVFSSADTVRDFGIENLVRLGVHLLWIGVESKTGPVYAKNEGIDHRELVRELRNHGISVLGSGILCDDHHTPTTVQEDIEHLVSIEPDMVQFMLLTGLPVTEVYREHKRRGLLRGDLPFEEWHGQKMLTFNHPEFPGDQPEKLIHEAFRRDYERNSSTMYRMIETAVRGFKTLTGDPAFGDAEFDVRREWLRKRVQDYRPLLPVVQRHAVNDLERERALQLEATIAEMLGPMSSKQRMLSAIARGFAWRWAGRCRLFGDRIQPRSRLTRYRPEDRENALKTEPLCRSAFSTTETENSLTAVAAVVQQTG